MEIDFKKLLKAAKIDRAKEMIRENKQKIKQLITDKKPEEAILLSIKNNDIKQVVKMLKNELKE